MKKRSLETSSSGELGGLKGNGDGSADVERRLGLQYNLFSIIVRD